MQLSSTGSQSRRTLYLGLPTLVLAAVVTVLLTGTNGGQAFLRVYAPWLASRPQSADKPRPADLPASQFLEETELIPWVDPGLVIDAGPPQGWSHLVIKNNVRVANKVATDNAPKADSGESWNDLIGTFWLAIMANVRRLSREPTRYELEKVGMGWCRRVDGHDVTISTSTLRTQKVELSPVESLLLAMQELSCEQNMFIRARSSCTLIYDVQRYLVLDERHTQGQLRHAILVHPQTGELAAFYWIVPPTTVVAPKELTIDRLPPKFVTTYDLHYQPNSGRLKGMPSESDYATVGLPECAERHTVAEKHRQTFLAQQVSGTVARELEGALRGYLGWHVVE